MPYSAAIVILAALIGLGIGFAFGYIGGFIDGFLARHIGNSLVRVYRWMVRGRT